MESVTSATEKQNVQSGRKNRRNWQPAKKTNFWFVWPARKQTCTGSFPWTLHFDRKVERQDSRRSLSVSERTGEMWASRAGFPPKEESWSETAVSSTLHDCMLLCNSRTLFTCVSSASLLFYTFNILHVGRRERLTLLFNYCFIYSVKLLLMTKKEKKNLWEGEVKHAFKSVLLIVACRVFAAICDYWA